MYVGDGEELLRVKCAVLLETHPRLGSVTHEYLIVQINPQQTRNGVYGFCSWACLDYN